MVTRDHPRPRCRRPGRHPGDRADRELRCEPVLVDRPRRPGWRDPRPARPVRLRQDHPAALHRRPRTTHLGHADDRTPRCHRRPGRAGGATPGRHGLRGRRAVPASKPWLGERQSTAFPAGRDRRDRSPRCALVGLDDKGGRMPGALSGGEQQRVALARALAPGPSVVLLDEPFSSLDAALRVQLRDEVRRLLTGVGVTAILVTHDQEEAMKLRRPGRRHEIRIISRWHTRGRLRPARDAVGRRLRRRGVMLPADQHGTDRGQMGRVRTHPVRRPARHGRRRAPADPA